MLRSVLFFSFLLTHSCEKEPSTSVTRVKELYNALFLETNERFNAIVNYLRKQDLPKYFPSYSELISFLRLIQSLDSNIFHEKRQIITDTYRTTGKLIYRLFHIPLNKDANEVAALLLNDAVKTVICYLRDADIPISFHRALEAACEQSNDKEICGKRSAYVYNLGRKLHSYSEVIENIKSIKENLFFITNKTRKFLFDFPLAFIMKVDGKSLMEAMLEEPESATNLLKTSAYPYFPIRRVDDDVFCEKKLSEMTPPNTEWYKAVVEKWKDLPSSCFDGEDSTSSLTAHFLYNNFEYNQRVLHVGYRFEVSHSVTVPQLAAHAPIYSQYLGSLIPLIASNETAYYPVLCKMFEFVEGFTSLYWNPLTNEQGHFMDFWGHQLNKKCNETTLRNSLTTYFHSINSKRLKFPSLAVAKCFQPQMYKLQFERLVDLTYQISVNEYAVEQMDMRQQIINRIKEQNRDHFASYSKCHALKSVYFHHLFDPALTSLQTIHNMAEYFDSFALERMKSSVRDVYKTPYFHQFLEKLSPKSLQRVIKETDLVYLLLSEQSREFGFFSFVLLLDKLDRKRGRANKLIQQERWRSLNKMHMANFVLYKIFARKLYADIDSSNVEPYHVTLFKKLLGNRDLRGDARNVYYDSYGDLMTVREKVLRCYESLISSSKVQGEWKSLQLKFLKNDFYPNDKYLFQLVRHNLCLEIKHSNNGGVIFSEYSTY